MNTTQAKDRAAQRRFNVMVNRELVWQLHHHAEALTIVEVAASLPVPDGADRLAVGDSPDSLTWGGAIQRVGSKTVIGPDGCERRVPVWKLGDREKAKRYFMTTAREVV